ncbi:MAG: 50S ribosomal protein L1 [Candidatus Aenigmarchaeota archaeon]|nr:50S ribosomal protein L1 [Candidatus Aenigmarchaeota archaeon]
MIDKNTLMDAMKKARESAKGKNFTQSWDLSVSLKEMDMKKAESRLSEDFMLPNGLGKNVKVAVISDTITQKATGVADSVITKDQLPAIGQDKKSLKKLAAGTDFFLSEISLMPLVGKHMGPVLAPRGKMPKPIPPNADVKTLVERTKKYVRIKLKDSPVVNVIIGNEKMDDGKVIENIESVMEFLERKLPKGKDNFKNITVKLTMGKPEKVRVQ